MSDYIVVFICVKCGHLGQPESVWHEDGSGGEHRCSNCKHVVGIWLDHGKLDLGLIEDDGGDNYVIYDRPS